MFVVLPGKVVSVGQTISKIPPEQLMSTPTVADLLQSRKSTLKRAFRTLYYGAWMSFFISSYVIILRGMAKARMAVNQI